MEPCKQGETNASNCWKTRWNTYRWPVQGIGNRATYTFQNTTISFHSAGCTVWLLISASKPPLQLRTRSAWKESIKLVSTFNHHHHRCRMERCLSHACIFYYLLPLRILNKHGNFLELQNSSHDNLGQPRSLKFFFNTLTYLLVFKFMSPH